MLWKLVADYRGARNDAGRAAAANSIVDYLESVPFSIHFHPDGPPLFNGSMSCAVRGRPVGLIQELEISLTSKTQEATVRAAIPFNDTEEELQVREVMEDGYSLAKSADEYAKLLRSAGVDVVRIPVEFKTP